MFSYIKNKLGYFILYSEFSPTHAPSNRYIAYVIGMNEAELSKILRNQFNSKRDARDNLFENEEDVQQAVEWLNSLEVANKLAQ